MVPSRSRPAWLATPGCGNPGIVAYGMSTAAASVSATAPSPDPSTIPTRGAAAGAAARIAVTAASRASVSGIQRSFT